MLEKLKEENKIWAELYDGPRDGGKLILKNFPEVVEVDGETYDNVYTLNRRGCVVFIHRNTLTHLS